MAAADEGILYLIDLGGVGAVIGYWEDYLSTMRQWRGSAAASIPSSTDWQGGRATRFRSWWSATEADLDTVEAGLIGLIDAVTYYGQQATYVNAPLDDAISLIRQNCDQVTTGDNTVEASFEHQHFPISFSITAAAFVTEPDEVTGIGWLETLRRCLLDADRRWGTTNAAAITKAHAALGQLTHLHHLTPFGRDDPTGSPFLGDTTWSQLTGGGVIRPPMKGFTHPPFSTAGMPSWYGRSKPGVIDTILDGIVDNLSPIVTIAGVLTGQPELVALGTAIGVVTAAGQIVRGIATGDFKDAVEAAIGIVISEDDIPDLAEAVVRQIGGGELTGKLSEQLTDWVQDQLTDAIETQLIDGKSVQVVPSAALQEIAAEAAAKLQVMRETQHNLAAS